MRKVRELLRLKYGLGLSNRQVAGSLGISHVCVGEYLRAVQEAGIPWPLPEGWDERELETKLFGPEDLIPQARRALPDMDRLHRELRRKGVTRRLLWEEYLRDHPEGYGYTQFCEYYDRWRKTLEPTLRQEHAAGEKMFVDWAGSSIELKGGAGEALLFVAVLGASNFTYAEAFENRKLPAWVDGHVHAWEYMGGVARLTVPDNEKTGISKACFYEPELNRTYADLAAHYGTVVLPTRPRKPRDKAKVESAVLHAQRRILAALRNRSFFSLAELNAAIREQLDELNERPFQKLRGSRRALLEELERPELLPLPARRYRWSAWKKAKVGIDYHVQVDKHFYSVPYGLVGRQVDVRLTHQVVEILHRGRRVASHPRSCDPGKFSTDAAHRPKSHQRHLEWTPRRLIDWAGEKVGPWCAQTVETILNNKPHPEQGYRSCLGIIRLSKAYGPTRMEAACRRAMILEVCSYQSLKSILKTKLDQQVLPEDPVEEPLGPRGHANLRGQAYYGDSGAEPHLSTEGEDHAA